MPVTSTTLAGVNVWQLSGNVTDAELKTAWAGLIVNNRYLLGRTIYIDSTCSLVNARGTYYIDCQNLGVILHLSRNKANTVFRNWVLTQTVGLSVAARNNFVRFTNGTTITNSTTDGIDMQGGAMIYAVIGNPGGADPRFLNEMQFGSLNGTLVTSAAWTEQEIEPTSVGTIWRGLNIQKAAGYPILSNTSGTQRQVIYRSNFNTEGATLRLIRPYFNNSLCYVSSVVRRQGAVVTSNLMDTFGSTGSAVIMVLNTWLDESWFGASKTNLTGANWNAGNRVIGGVMKKILVQPSTLIRTYDSRSTTVSQKSTFSETTQDFLSGTDSTTSDAVTGRAQIVCVGAIATGGSIAITRYTGQRFTLQKFSFRVQVETPDMTFGDDDLSAFSPITMTAQTGIVRTEAAINAATTVDTLQQLLEELHVLAIGLVGAPSYNGAYTGNLFDYSGSTLTTSFASATVDPSAASKIAFNSGTNALTIKSTVLAGTSAANLWVNTAGPITVIGAFTFSATANIIQATPTNLSNLTITGNLTFNTNSNITVTFTNCTVTGTVSNSGTGTVTITNNDSTFGTVGANVTVRLAATLTINSLIATSSVALYDGSGTQVDYVASSGTSYTYDATGGAGTWTWKVRKYGQQDQSGTFTPSTGSVTITASYLPDTFVVDTLVNVIAYTNLQTTQKVYDYSRYFATTATGMDYGMLFTKGFGTLTANESYTLEPTAVTMLSVTAGVVTTHTTGFAEIVTLVVDGNFTQGAATLSNDVTIRADNLNSEILFSGIDSLTVYATQSDALTNTSPGATSTTGIIRYEYGVVLSGVTMSGAVYVRTLFGTTVQVQALVLIAGTTTLDLSTTSLLQSVLTGVDNVSENVWAYENRTINKALFT